ncbi:M20 family metallo-hydrolase [uncultured Bilophila sp.]|uniref:M20 family metallo-hydrolase n=2 Tax=uncultured Bilophila sp. TaxID=529385 RepID=UPI0025D199B0|nr:M20 family metallo-hydrolase [uncultured Bilophila sp.]
MRAERLLATLEELAGCNATPGEGITRFSWSEADRAARRVLERELRAIGLEPWSDGMGNLHARLKGRTDAPALLTGSHLDTVRHGGRYDGTYGVVASLEALRSFHDEGFTPDCDVEFIAFAEEEGSNFGPTCLGSKGLAGEIGPDDLRALSNAEGSAYDKLRAFGLDPDRLPEECLDPARVRAFLEVHIEQGGELEKAGVPLGIVTAISGMRLHRLTLRGRSDHAASPMQGRRDPAAGFAEIAHRMEGLWKDGVLPEDFSCTVGEMACSPNVGIVVPDTVTFTIDIRHVDVSVLEEGWKRIEAMARSVAESRGLVLDLVRLSASGGVPMAAEIGEAFRLAAGKRGVQPLFMKSGPAHDAASMGRRVPAGLLFVPSIKGLSHCPQEDTAPEHLALGASVLEDALRFLAGGGRP